MATISDVRNGIVGLAAGVLYPGGVPGGNVSPIAGCKLRIFAGWPERESLDADMAQQIVQVSVYCQRAGINTTRFPPLDQAGPLPPVTLGWTILGQVVTVTGTVSVPQNIGLVVDGAAYLYGVLPADTLSTIATAVAALVNVAQPASATGPVITMPNAKAISGRVGVIAGTMREVGREKATVQIDIWAPSEALRNAVGAPVEPVIRDQRRLLLDDGSIAMIWYQNTWDDDGLAKSLIYRRTLVFFVEYASIVASTQAEAIALASTLTQAADVTQSPVGAQVVRAY